MCARAQQFTSGVCTRARIVYACVRMPRAKFDSQSSELILFHRLAGLLTIFIL